VSQLRDDEIEKLRSLVRHAHDKRDPLIKRVLQKFKRRLGERVQRESIVHRLETPQKETHQKKDAA
jgi:hypothetical protein